MSSLEIVAGDARVLRTGRTTRVRPSPSKGLAESSKSAVSLYATAVALGRFYGVVDPHVTHAEERLAAFTVALGNWTMQDYVTRTPDPTDPSGRIKLAYTDGMYLQH